MHLNIEASAENKGHLVPLWRQILRKNFIDWQKLALFLELSSEQYQHILPSSSFRLNLPLRLAQKIAKKTLNDPILLQFLPTQNETISTPGFHLDPVNDRHFRQETKLLKKYAGRALLLCTSACAMHCRYCFRQNFDYDYQNKEFTKELTLIQQDPSLQEIILSGGDPLSLDDAILNSLLNSLDLIPHVKRIRFHTRFPIGIPERINDPFLTLLKQRRAQIFFVIHVNYPSELDQEILTSLKQIQSLGIPILNQSVLLKGVNDSLSIQKLLCETLVNHGILPYYLHQLDRVQGTAHFEVDTQQGLLLIKDLSAHLSGYAVPKYVSEVPGAPNKTSLF